MQEYERDHLYIKIFIIASPKQHNKINQGKFNNAISQKTWINS